MAKLVISIIVSLVSGISAAFMLNYLDTGKIYKILSGHRLRFWTTTIGTAFFAVSWLTLFSS
jgi:hypothetical protein